MIVRLINGLLLDKRRDRNKPQSQILLIGSIGGLNRYADSFIYNASKAGGRSCSLCVSAWLIGNKAGAHHLMKNLGAFLVPFDIRTNIVAPGCESQLIWT